MVLSFKSRVLTSYGAGKARVSHPEALPNQVVEDECTQLWPNSKVRPIIDLGKNQEALEMVADKLTALSFYIELAEHPFWTASPAVIETIIKCRLPPGPILTSLAERLYSKRILLRFV